MNEADLGAKALWTLIPISALFGVVAAWLFGRFADRVLVRRSVNRVVAHILELRLFLDSPRLVFKAQGDLLRENLHLLRLIMLPAGASVVLFALLFPQLNAIYSRAPLAIGRPSVVTAHLNGRVGNEMPTIRLEAPAGIEVETPGVRIVRSHEVSWRLRPGRSISGDLVVHVDGRVVTSPIVARTGLHRLADHRVDDPAISWVEIRYAHAGILGFHWLAWFIVCSSISAVLFGLARGIL